MGRGARIATPAYSGSPGGGKGQAHRAGGQSGRLRSARCNGMARAMQAFRPLTAFQRHLMIALFACAVLVRMAVPEGWMPVTDANGAVRMTICTGMGPVDAGVAAAADHTGMNRSEEHTSELQSLMRISYAVFCLKK